MIKHFLLVDDDSDDRELFVEALAKIDSTITCDLAQDGTEAIDKLRSGTYAKPDVIFLDVNMPVISGWECLDELKNDGHFKEIPVIMYSTSSHTRDRQIAADKGAAYFFTKPNEYGELIRFLASVIADLQNNAANIYG